MENLIVKVEGQRVECEAKIYETDRMLKRYEHPMYYFKKVEPTQYMIKYNNHWRRVYVEMFCNHSIVFIKVKGEKLLVEVTY